MSAAVVDLLATRCRCLVVNKTKSSRVNTLLSAPDACLVELQISTWCLSQFARAGEQATGRKPRFAKSSEARIYAPVRGEFANLGFLPSDFANLLEVLFCGFAKNLNLPSAFAKLFELLLVAYSIFSV
jgi:hypothetical protein